MNKGSSCDFCIININQYDYKVPSLNRQVANIH